MLNLRKLYIKANTILIFKKYIANKYMKEKILYYTGEFELEKLKTSYEVLCLENRLEDMFKNQIFAMSGINAWDDRYSSFSDAVSRKEYYDLEKRIKSLERNMKNNVERYSKFEKIIKEYSTISKIEDIVKNTDPFLNKTEKDSTYENFISDLEMENIETIDIYYNNALKKTLRSKRNRQEDYLGKIKIINEEIDNLEKKFPFTHEKNVSSQENLDRKLYELLEEIEKTHEAMDRLSNIYILAKANKGLII